MHIPAHLVLLTATALLATAASGQTTTRETVSSTGVQGTSGCGFPVLSADGRFVAFRSASPNLVPGDTNGRNDTFVRDRVTGQTTRVSVDSAGVQANGDSGQSYLSANGRFVVFESFATNLVVGDTNGLLDIFCHDRQTGQTTRVNLGASGQQAATQCTQCSISADGRFVTFQSPDNNLVPGDICVGTDIFLRDRQLGTTVIVSASILTGQTFTSRQNARISADGSTVVFDSRADDLVSNDTNGQGDIFAWSRLTGSMTRASLTSAGQEGNGESLEASVSGTGRYVVFSSAATNFGGGVANGSLLDIFVRDTLTGQTTCANLTNSGADANGFGQGGSITDDGRYVTFWSGATNLIPNDTNGVYDCFLRDRQNATTTRVSVSSAGIEGFRQSTEPLIAAGGRYITFTGTSTNFVLPDTNGTADIFVRDLEATAVALAYGTSCRGTSPFGPQAEGVGQPFVGNGNFAVGVWEGFPQRLAILAMGLAPASIPYGPCNVLLGGTVISMPSSFTNIAGFASTPCPIPANPAFAGLTLYAQYAVFDPNGLLLGIAALSQGLAITLNLP